MSNCPLGFASPACGWKDGMPGDPMVCAKTFEACRDHGNEERFGGQPRRPADPIETAPVEQLPAGPCARLADLVVYRGRTKRRFLCHGHRHTYTGTGRVMDYEPDDRYGRKRCGETVG